MDEYVFENIKRLETPVGYFSITDGEKEMPFSVKKAHILYTFTEKKVKF